MAFEDSIESIAERIPELRSQGNLDDEAKTKQFLVVPFLRALGYDDSAPSQVIPEFTADFGGRQGWKVDYALISSGQPVIIIECKESKNLLTKTEIDQLGRYFPFTKARICILTNGILYQFFSETENTNTMDSNPFLEIDLEHMDLKSLEELGKFSRGFDVDERLAAASDRKIVEGMKHMLARQHSQPDDNFLELFVRPLHTGNYNQAAKDKFRPLLQEAAREFIRERLNATFQAAQSFTTRIDGEESAPQQSGDAAESGKEIETTAQEWQAYDIVKAIIHDLVASDRVAIRDAQSYCAVLLDNNNRRPMCRFYFNGQQKRLGLFDGSRAGSGALNVRQYDIESLDDIHNHTEQFRETVRRYLES